MTSLRKLSSVTALVILSWFLPSRCLPFSSQAADGSDRLREIVDAAIRPVMTEHEVPGMAVAVALGGKALFLDYGVASRETGTPVSKRTLFEIGSVSKVLTATLATYAQALGKLSLDDRPGKYLPQLQGKAIDRASLLEFGTFTAGGLPLQFPDEVSDDERMIVYFRRWQPDAEPGTQRRYSNPSIGLLGLVTAVALEHEFVDAMQARLLPELGMNHSHIRVPERAMADYAWGYAKANVPIRVNPGPLDAQAYGIKSTAEDMIRFVQANIEPRRLAAPVQQAIAATHTGHFEVGGMVQGLGWEQYPYPVSLERLLAGNGTTLIMEPNRATPLKASQAPSRPILFNKTGSTHGFGAYVAFVPQKKIGIVMLANRNFPIPARIKAAHAILEHLAPMAQ